MEAPLEDEQIGYPIGAVVKLTGLTTHNIRVWEKRHQAVLPRRLPSGRRLYSQTQVDRLVLLKKCIDRGFSIGEIASFKDQVLESKLAHIIEEKQQVKKTCYTLGALARTDVRPMFSSTLSIDVIYNEEIADFSKSHSHQKTIDTKPDFLVLEVPSLGPADTRSILELMKRASPQLVILIYRYASQMQLTALRNQGLRLLKAPFDQTSLEHLVAGFLSSTHNERHSIETHELSNYPKHLFSSLQLKKLANLPTNIDCECPHHLVDLLEGLKEFEKYSGTCINKNDEDAALHAKIQITTARARHQLEVLLQDVLEAEKIQIEQIKN